MLKESYNREDIAPPLSREERQSHNSETGTDTDTVKQTNTHTRGKESKHPQDMALVEAREGRGPSGTGVTGEGHAHLSEWKRYARMKRSKLAGFRNRRANGLASPKPKSSLIR